jgi:hypothetical protein
VVPMAADVAAEGADLTADVTGAAEGVGVTAEVSAEAAELVPVAAEVLEPEPVAGTVAAWACRENTSKTTKIPAAMIATCIARRAMCRKIGCGMSSSRTTGTEQTWLSLPMISGPKHRRRTYFRPISPWSP